MNYTDYKAVLTLADNLNKNGVKLQQLMDQLSREEAACRDGIRDYGGECVTKYVRDVEKEVKLTTDNLELVRNHLIEYADKVRTVLEMYKKLNDMNVPH